jgi:hypothetical protein
LVASIAFFKRGLNLFEGGIVAFFAKLCLSSFCAFGQVCGQVELYIGGGEGDCSLVSSFGDYFLFFSGELPLQLDKFGSYFRR